MFHYSTLRREDYCQNLKDNLDSITNFGQERFTGFVLGRFFSITHHCSHEWNRRITAEMNTAIGIVEDADIGCKVRYITIPGILRPQSFLLYTTLCLIIFLIEASATAFFTSLPVMIAASFGLALFVGIINAVQVCLTENGRAGRELLHNLLKNPKSPYLS